MVKCYGGRLGLRVKFRVDRRLNRWIEPEVASLSQTDIAPKPHQDATLFPVFTNAVPNGTR
jgi:hypothetical protein